MKISDYLINSFSQLCALDRISSLYEGYSRNSQNLEIGSCIRGTIAENIPIPLFMMPLIPYCVNNNVDTLLLPLNPSYNAWRDYSTLSGAVARLRSPFDSHRFTYGKIGDKYYYSANGILMEQDGHILFLSYFVPANMHIDEYLRITPSKIGMHISNKVFTENDIVCKTLKSNIIKHVVGKEISWSIGSTYRYRSQWTQTPVITIGDTSVWMERPEEIDTARHIENLKAVFEV